MNIVTLDYIKAHSRIDEITSGSAEESLVTLYADSAEETVLNYIDRTIAELTEEYGKIPSSIKHAVLLLVDNSYQFRSPSSVQNLYRVDYSFDALVKPYMNL